MNKKIEQSELQGFSRTLAELEWLLLALVLLYFVLPIAEVDNPFGMIVAMALFVGFIISFRYSRLFTAETQWKLAIETWAITVFITWCVYLTGGIDSPLLNLYLLVIIFSALTLGKLVALLEFLLIAAVYFYLAQPQYAAGGLSLASFADMAMTFAPFLLVAYFTSLLAADLRHAREGLEELSDTDELTGLKNRRAFKRAFDSESRKASRYQRSFSILMLDADNLKTVNDRFGHAVGDRLLVSIAGVIRETLRETDVLARYGGDEFVVILTETSLERAIEVAERIRAAVEHTSFSAEGERVSSTVSIGIASYHPSNESQDEVVIRADRKLYESKQKGKNTISH